MIEYANESVIKLLKQYDMLAKSLNYVSDIAQKNEICKQMTKIIQQVLEITNSIYEVKYKEVSNRSVYLMDDEKNRLSELINIISERRVYVNNQVSSNEELTGVSFEVPPILGEDKLDEYKSSVKVIERYKGNIRLEGVLKEEIQNLNVTIKKANDKINNNKNLNRQLEEKMIRLFNQAFDKLSLFELRDREKEIDLAYTELGYSLEKAKENAKIARRECSEDIIVECDNILASTTLDYERFKEKKLILKLIYLYQRPVENYDELLHKREEMNAILMNIVDSELYAMIGNEINKQYSTIKLESQDVSTLKSLTEERDAKTQQLQEIKEENNSDSVKGLLSVLLANERKYQEKLEAEKRKREQEQLELQKIEEQKKIEEIRKRQKALEEERNKEIEQRTKELLNAKKNSIFVSSNKDKEKTIKNERKQNSIHSAKVKPTVTNNRPVFNNRYLNDDKRNSVVNAKNASLTEKVRYEERKNNGLRKDSSSPFPNVTLPKKDDFFGQPNRKNHVVDDGIPVIKNNTVVSAKKVDNESHKVFPDIPMTKKDNIFPDVPKEEGSSFFDKDEFDELSNYMEGNNNKNWF